MYNKKMDFYLRMSGEFFETFVISEILKSYSNRGLDYRYFVSYYRGKDKKKVKKRGTGAVVCMCSMPEALRDNVLQIPYWYI